MIYFNGDIKQIHYSGFTISKAYACGGNLVWSGDTPTPPTSNKLTIHTMTSGGAEHTMSIPCDGSNRLTLQECYDLLNGTGSIVLDVYVGDCVEVLESDCFFSYSSNGGIWNLYLPTGLKTWQDSGAASSDGLTGLKNINIIPSAITVLPKSSRNKKFTSYTLPNTVTDIDDFFAGSPLSSFTMSESQTESGVFDGCTSLTGITIPSAVTTIENNAFNNCTSLKSFVFNGNNVTSIGNKAFGLAFSQSGWNRSLTLPNSITTIGNNAFDECKLLSLTIGENITNIGNAAFQWSSLEEVIIYATTPPTLGTNAFNSVTGLTSIYVPDASVNAYKTASDWSTYANYIKPISEKP